ncbi:MAG TPA: SHOCT domain-containing protein [Candidatus Didemnitutus sp.]|nr:SHOCT domain-containing protein [Candidatus Didemnitutus sp.]
MNTPTLGRFVFALSFFLAFVGGAAAASSKVTTVNSGGDTYTTTAKASNGFNRDVASLKDDAQQAAEQYCASLGKKLKVLSSKVEKPFFGTGYVRVVLVFRALDANDPAMNSEVAVTADGRHVLVPMASAPQAVAAPAAAPVPAAAPAPAPENTTEVYNDLLKLDDLRKRGILTEEEFQAEKKKVLARSQ